MAQASTRYFVTGGAGFIGSHLVDRLVGQGDSVTVYDNLLSGKRSHLEHHVGKENFRFIQADLLDFAALKAAMKGHDIIWHLGANTDIPGGNRVTDLDLRNCTMATRYVLEAMKELDIKKLLFASSATVYGDAPAVSLSEAFGPLLPISLYGAGKLACEGLISAYAHLFDIRACIFRFANVVGARMGHGVIYDFIQKLRANPAELEILGDGQQEKPFFLVEDCLDGMVCAFEKSDGGFGVYNLGCESYTNVTRIAEIVSGVMGLPHVRFRYTGGRRGWPGDVPVVHYSVDKMKQLGWRARYTSDEAVRIAAERLPGDEMKTVVTGGNGFIGSHLVKKLFGEGREVTVVTDLARLGTENLSGLGLDNSQYELVKADLTDYGQARCALSGAGSIFHLAAVVGSLTYLHGSATAELTALQRNLGIDANVFRVALEEGVKRLVYASSVAVYPMERQASSGAVFREEDLAGVSPDGGYGWSKLAGEVQLGLMTGVAIGIARIFNIYGENEPLAPGRAHVVGDLMRKVAGGVTELRLQGDGRQSRDFLYAGDCAEALFRLEDRAASPALVVNIGSGVGTTVGDIARKIIAISARDVKLTFDPSQPIGPVSRTADISRAKRLLGWQPQVSLDEGLRRGYRVVERALAGSSL